MIDRADWLDIRQRTEDEISAARREYDRLAGSATVMGDIPASERVRDAWEAWGTDRRRAAGPRRAGWNVHYDPRRIIRGGLVLGGLLNEYTYRPAA